MEFPGTKITKNVRRGILLFFFLAFLVTTPLTLLYTIGYRYDFNTHLILSTGAINIDIEPANASIYIDGVLQQDGMPLRLKDKMPGKYNVIIKANGYFDWQKIVEVKSKQTEYIKDISMLKKNDPVSEVSGNVDDFSLSPNGKYLIYSIINNEKKEIKVKNLDNSEEKTALTLNTSTVFDFTWSPNQNYVTIADTQVPHNLMYIIRATEPEKYTDLIDIINYPITKFMWRDSLESEMYYSTALKISSLLPDSGERLAMADNNFIDWFMEGDVLWALEKNTSTGKISLSEDVLGFKRSFAKENVFEADENNLEILTIKNEHALLKKKNESEMILLTKDKKFNINGEKFLISKFSDWWIIWTPWEIWTYAEGGEPILLNRTGQQLKKIVPLDRYNTLALNWAEKTTALFPYYLVTHDLVSQTVNDIFANTDTRILYLQTEINGQKGIWKMGY